MNRGWPSDFDIGTLTCGAHFLKHFSKDMETFCPKLWKYISTGLNTEQNIEHILINHQDIKSFNFDDIHPSLPRLRELDFSNNNITSLHQTLRVHRKHRRMILSFANNPITDIADGFLDYIPHIGSIDLSTEHELKVTTINPNLASQFIRKPTDFKMNLESYFGRNHSDINEMIDVFCGEYGNDPFAVLIKSKKMTLKYNKWGLRENHDRKKCEIFRHVHPTEDALDCRNFTNSSKAEDYFSLMSLRCTLQQLEQGKLKLDIYDKSLKITVSFPIDEMARKVRKMNLCKSEKFFNKVQRESAALNRLERNVEITDITFDLASLTKHTGPITESVLIRADTVYISQDLFIHYNLSIRAREVHISKMLSMTLTASEILEEVKNSIVIEKRIRMEKKGNIVRHRVFGHIDIVDVLRDDADDQCCSHTKVFEFNEAKDDIDTWFTPLQIALIQACTDTLDLSISSEETKSKMSSVNVDLFESFRFATKARTYIKESFLDIEDLVSEYRLNQVPDVVISQSEKYARLMHEKFLETKRYEDGLNAAMNNTIFQVLLVKKNFETLAAQRESQLYSRQLLIESWSNKSSFDFNVWLDGMIISSNASFAIDHILLNSSAQANEKWMENALRDATFIKNENSFKKARQEKTLSLITNEMASLKSEVVKLFVEQASKVENLISSFKKWRTSIELGFKVKQGEDFKEAQKEKMGQMNFLEWIFQGWDFLINGPKGYFEIPPERIKNLTDQGGNKELLEALKTSRGVFNISQQNFENLTIDFDKAIKKESEDWENSMASILDKASKTHLTGIKSETRKLRQSFITLNAWAIKNTDEQYHMDGFEVEGLIISLMESCTDLVECVRTQKLHIIQSSTFCFFSLGTILFF